MIAFTARVLFALYFFLFPFVGLLVAYIGFCDPDTCWHLALGKWMFTHGSLPRVDPFSSNIHDFVFVSKDLPLMQHEWLSDLLFYSLFASCGAIGLLVLVGLLSLSSFVILPAVLMRSSRVPRSVTIICLALTVWASAFRLWVRPEAFSFLGLAALIVVNELGQRKRGESAIFSHLLIAAIMLFWANLHALFILGIAYLAGYFLLTSIDSLILKQSAADLARSLTALLAAFLGTLATPWNFSYWPYICRLAMSPISHMNKENGPLTIAEVFHPTFAPLLLWLVLIVSLCLLMRNSKEAKSMFFPIALALAGTALFILFRRLTPFALLIMITAVAKLFSLPNRAELDSSQNRNDKAVSLSPLRQCQEILLAGETSWQDAKAPGWQINTIGLAFAAASTVLAALLLVPPTIPSPSRLFKPPCAAIGYLDRHRPDGRLLNDSKFGSMMTWTMKNPPDLFIDGRFDSYDREVVENFTTMRLCRDHWQQLLRKYRIDWVFFPPDAPIVQSLQKAKEWSVAYADPQAVILTRKKEDSAD